MTIEMPVFRNYCDKTGNDFYEAKDMIEERIGNKVECECQILGDERIAGRKQVQSIFRLGFGGGFEKSF